MNKRRLAFICLVIAFVIGAGSLSAQPAQPAAPSAGRDELFFRNGDILFGRLQSVSSNQILQWRHPDASEPLSLLQDSIAEVDFPSAGHSLPAASDCKVLFSNGDLLRGKLLAADADSISLDVAGVGRLALPRNRLQSLAMASTEPPLIDGITGMDGWTEVSSPVAALGGPAMESGHWTYRNGAFYVSKPASIARDFKLPDMMRMEFDLAWRGTPNLAIALYTDSLKPILLMNKENGPDFGGFYSFRLGGIVADMYPIKKRGASISLGSVILASLGRSDHAHFDLRVSKPQNSILLLVDGALVMRWSDPNGFEGEGSGIRFVENSGALKVSNLRIVRWDGMLEEKSGPAPNNPTDVVWLRDGQSIAANITGITGQDLTLRAQNNSQTVPLAKIREIDFAAPNPRPTPEAAGGVRAIFSQGGSIHAQLESWSSDAAIFRSADFGRAKFNPSLFASFQFLHDEGN